jgi:exopolysaccharide production protein ExoY
MLTNDAEGRRFDKSSARSLPLGAGRVGRSSCGFGNMSTSQKAGHRGTPELAGPPPVEGWKRALDIACVVAVTPILVPLGLLIALFIKIVSPGPVLFRQERVGYGSRRFECLKFRSMRVNADTTLHQKHLEHLMTANVPLVKMDARGDGRLIRFGRLMRATGLDELPQVLNVLRGEMSLVGPRPCVPYEYERFSEWQKQRFDALPGLTGLWQVSGKNNTTFEEMMELDVWYAQHRTLGLDLAILFKTLPAVLSQVKELAARRGQRPLPSTPVCARTES